MANEFKVKNGLIVSGSAEIEQDLRVKGILTVDEFHTSITTSSIIYESGSTAFGNSLDDTHNLTGSVNITGSITLNGQAIGTGKLDEETFNTYTASYKVATTDFNGLTSSYNSFTTSYVSDSSSFDTRIGSLESFSSSLDASFVNETEFSTFSGSVNAYTTSLNTYTNSLENRLGFIEISTSSLNTFSSSTNSRLNLIETSTGSLNTFSSSTNTRLTAIETSTSSLNSFTSSINTTIKNRLNAEGVISGSSQILFNSSIVSSSAQVTAYGFATTGSNLFIGTQTHSGSILPSVDNLYDLGSPDYQWRDVYISSGSLYIDGTKVISSTAQELVITTDNGQSIKILEGTTDSIVLQTADGDIELKSSADGDILLDPTNGKIMLKGPVEILNGQKIQSSVGGTPVVFANDIVVSGSIDITGTIEGIDLTVFSSSVNARLTNLENSGGSLNSFTASAITRLNSLESTTGSLNTYTSSNNTRLGAIELTTSSLNTFTSSASTRLTSIETSTSSLNSYTSSNNSRLSAIESTTSSLNTFTSSTNGRLNTIESTTGSLNTFTSSTNSKLNSIETSTSSLNSYTASANSKFTSIESVTSSFASYSGTTNTRLNTIETSTGSLNSFTSSTNSKLSSIESTTASIISTNTTQDGRLTTLENKTGSYATTGSNIFIGDQTITGSLYVSQDLIIGGSSSIQHISSSVVNIADNIITVNAQNPSVRFGGLAVIDSGSSPQVSGSMLFDSVNNQWLFVHQNQGTITSSVLLMGPETFNNLGNETYITANRLVKSTGIEHLTDSNITDTGTKVSINSNTEITGTFVATGTALVSGSSQINHNATTNYDANQHVDHTAVSITAGNGLSGGGTIASTRTITLDTGSTHFLDGVKKELNTENVVSGSSQITYSGLSGIPSGIVSGSSQITYSGLSGIPSGIISGSVQVDLTSTTNYVSGIKTRLNTENVLSSSAQVVSALPAGTISGSSQVLNGTTIHSGSFFNGITVVSGSAQISFNGITDKPTLVSGSSQITYSGLSGIPSGIVSGSSQISFGSISGVPSGLVSGSSQIDLTATTNYSTGIKTRLNAEGVLSGSAQVVAALPSGTVSGSAQIILSGTTGYSSVINQAVLTTSTPTFAELTITSNQDGKLTLRVPSSGDTNDWNYINFVGANGTRDMYFGTDSSGNPTWYRDDNGVNIGLGTVATVNGVQIVTNSGTWGISISGNAATVTNGVYTTGDQTIAGVKTLTSALRLNESGYGRIAYADNYHGMILRGIPNNAAGDITVGDYTSLIQHSGDFRFYRTNGTINELYFQVNASGLNWRSNTIWHAGNDGASSGLDADLLDGYHETSFVRLSANSSSPTNGTFAIGSASGRNFIQSHSSQPLDLNPLGNGVFINGTEAVRNTGTWGINITGTLSNGFFNINGNGYTIADADQWPYVYWLRDTANNWDEGLIKASSSRGFFSKAGWGIHMNSSRSFHFFSSGWDSLMGIEGATGNVRTKGTLTVGGNIVAATSSTAGRINFGTDADTIALYRDNTYDLVLQQNAASGNPVYIAGAGNVVISIDSNNNETDRAFIVGSNAVKSSNTLFSVNESGNGTFSGTLTTSGQIQITSADVDVRVNRGRFQVYNNAGTGNLGYRIRTDENGGWRWQFVDGGNTEYFGVAYASGNCSVSGTLTVASTLNLPNAGLISVNNEPDTWGARFRTTTSTANLGGQLKNIIWCGGGSVEGFAVTGTGTGTASFEVRNDGRAWIKENLTVGGTLTENSSIRYKKDIVTIENGLDKVLRMRGVTYLKKDNDVKEVGVIAEEIYEILPDLVKYNTEGLIDSVSYGRITAVLIEAIKELKTEIDFLKQNK